MAKIHFKYGAMNSGKTDTLIKTAHNYEERELNVVVIKPEIDTKGANRGIEVEGTALIRPHIRRIEHAVRAVLATLTGA